MKCFSCGDDANMKVIISVNGELEQVDICEKCYKEHVQNMMDYMKGEDGKLDPEKMQKAMFDIVKNNKGKLEEMLGHAFNIEDLNLDNIDFKNINLSDFDVEDLTNFTKNNNFGVEQPFRHDAHFRGLDARDININPNLFDPETGETFDKSGNLSSRMGNSNGQAGRRDQYQNRQTYRRPNNFHTNAERIDILQQSITRKKRQLDEYVDSEDYLAAASMRDQIRDINREIMLILELESK